MENQEATMKQYLTIRVAKHWNKLSKEDMEFLRNSLGKVLNGLT